MFGYFYHEVQVQQTPSLIFNICLQVEKWPEFMPAVISGKVLEKTPTSDLVEITAHVNNEVWSWRSARELDSENLKITFTRQMPKYPIEKMTGTWSIDSVTDVTRLQLTHEFSLAIFDLKMFDFLAKAIKENSRKDLAAIKNYAEALQP